jgi:hypothetical protein
LDNGVPIIPFYDNKADLELKSLTQYLKNLGSGPNIRKRNANAMRLSEYTSHKEPKTILNKLYDWEN